jgi:quercetin dioxygenase-like cupin family protein
MSRKQLTWLGCASVAALMATAAAGMEPHKAITADAIKWEAAPPALPAGAQAAVLYGDPSKEGVFAMRLKMPKGYQIPPHTHPKPEIVTIISGEGLLGMGEKADRKDVQRLPAGAFVAVSPGMAHSPSPNRTQSCSSIASARGRSNTLTRQTTRERKRSSS